MKLHHSRCTAAKLTPWAVACALALVAGCVAPQRATAPPAPSLQLLDAAELRLPPECAVAPGTVYRTLFDVQPDGTVTMPTSQQGDGCVHQALRDWVATFSYAPLQAATPVAFDWIAVTASRPH